MKTLNISIIALAIILMGCTKTSVPEITQPNSKNIIPEKMMIDQVKDKKPAPIKQQPQQVQKERFDFSTLDEKFKFSALLPAGFKVEYVSSIRSVNIYDPSNKAEKVIDKPQIFIRYFDASKFLSLSTVNILNQENTTRLGRPAIEYEIIKKASAADFSQQPAWRNKQHKLIDIRYSQNSPTTFFVFSYNPNFSQLAFEEFIDSIIFHNDKQSFVAPMDKFDQRISKKPFGIYITPQNSPVSPEKFSGYHTAVDLEVFSDEIEKEVMVNSICGGTIKSVRGVTGYGGVIAQDCLLENQAVVIIYGHVDVGSALVEVGQYVQPGLELVNLGEDKSSETSGERKHLHLGILKGSLINWSGYIDSQNDLSLWLDPQNVIK